MNNNSIFEIFFTTVSMLWNSVIKPLWLLCLIILAVPFLEFILLIIKKRKQNKQADEKYSAINQIQSDRQILTSLRNLKPAEFEDYISHLFNGLGFSTKVAGGSHDGGIDVIATKDGVKHYIQCKKFITSQVGVGAVRDFYGALVDHVANGKGYFITTNKFTLESEKFAEDKPIELIDGYKLLEYIKLVEKEGRDTLNLSQSASKCPKCNGLLILREGKFGEFYGCSNYPKCKHTKAL